MTAYWQNEPAAALGNNNNNFTVDTEHKSIDARHKKKKKREMMAACIVVIVGSWKAKVEAAVFRCASYVPTRKMNLTLELGHFQVCFPTPAVKRL